MAFQYGQTIRGNTNWNENPELLQMQAMAGQKLGDWKTDSFGMYIDSPWGKIYDNYSTQTNRDTGGDGGYSGPQFGGQANLGEYANQHGSDKIYAQIDKDGVLQSIGTNRESGRDRNMFLAAAATLGIGGALYGGAAAAGAGGTTAATGGAAGMGGGSGLTMGSGGVTGLTPGASGVGMTATGAGGGALSTGSAGALAPGYFASEGLGAGATSILGNAGVQQALQNMPASEQKGFLESLGMTPEAIKLLGGVAGAGFNLWNQNQQQDKLNEAAKGYADKVTTASQQAADMSKFTPFNVSGGLAGAKFDGNNVTQTLDPRMRAIQDQSLSQAGGFLNGVSAGTPDQLAKNAYANYNAWAKPAQEQQFSGLQDRLAAQGLIGTQVNTQGVPPVQSGQQQIGIQGGTNADFQSGGRFGGGGNTVSVNPYYKDFAQGVAQSDLKNYENSVRFGQETTNNQINMGKGMLGIGVGIDQLGNDAINQGAKLGEAQSRAGAVAGSFLANGARDAANVGMNRANDNTNADTERNRQIWESIFKNLF